MHIKLDASNLLKLISKCSPDLLWIKDLEGKYIYANNATCEKLLLTTNTEVIGKTDKYFTEKIKELYKDKPDFHKFNSCENSDKHTLDAMTSLKFIEKGNIQGVLTYFEVYKTPFFDENNTLIGTLGTARNITSTILLKEKIEELAFYDQLTSLPNRQKIIQDIKNNSPKACVCFNINNFKQINDFFGTNNADTILQKIAKIFIDNNYTAYRISADEFAILFYDDDTYINIKNKVKKILTLFDKKPLIIENQNITINFYIGIAISDEKLLTKVDIAVNISRNSQSNISFYEENKNLIEKYKHNIQVATKIKNAILENRVICHYQPIMDAKNNKICSYETLVRIVDENKEIIFPDKFLEFSKKTKLYTSITKIVVHNACETFKNKNENFSINLNIADIRNKNTINYIRNKIIETNTASKITFEILESEGIENYDDVINFISSMKELGSKIAIDDFGSGYSNFENVVKLDVDYIKIDGSLIENITLNEKYKIIVETIIDFSKKIGIKTIAEFVSNESILKMVKSIGIDFIQGNFLGESKEI